MLQKMEGTYDEATKTLTLAGESRTFAGKLEQVKTVSRPHSSTLYFLQSTLSRSEP
ncbi:MAG: hypothetical protein HY290_22915 [Planctomycetia bacterium]|nr:hypothetical protein [Planctomycetia bacterium]